MPCRSRERVAAVLAHRDADRVPLDALRTPAVLEMLDTLDVDEEWLAYLKEGEFKYLRFATPDDLSEFDPYLPDLPDGAVVSEWGVAKIALKSVEGFHAGHETRHPLAAVDTVAALEDFPFPDMSQAQRHARLEDAVAEAVADGFTVVGTMSQTILEIAYEMRGIERLMIDLVERPDYARALFGKIAEQRLFQARRLAEADVDVIRIGDDIATQQGLMVSPALYRDLIKPHHAEIVAAAREVKPDVGVLYHSDGKLTALLPDLIEIGVTAVNPCQPECMDVAETKRDFGADLTLWGCMPVQSVLANGSADEVEGWMRMLMRDVAPGGGLILNFINSIVTDRFIENMRVFGEAFEAVMKY